MADTKQEPVTDEKVSFLDDSDPLVIQPKIILHEAHFMPLHHQSNIYGLLNLCIEGSNKLVVTTLRGEVHCLEFHDPLIQRPPSFKPITFSFIPGTHRRTPYCDCVTYPSCAVGVEVVSIDAIMKEPNGVIIGIALIKVFK